MTVATVFSTISYNQNQGGPVVPAPSVINAGAPVNRHAFTLTVTPSSGWAKASLSAGLDGVNYTRQTEVFCSPGIGTSATPGGGSSIQGAYQYFTGEVTECSPGATATLTVTY
jgi:hypothetical protein